MNLTSAKNREGTSVMGAEGTEGRHMSGSKITENLPRHDNKFGFGFRDNIKSGDGLRQGCVEISGHKLELQG